MDRVRTWYDNHVGRRGSVLLLLGALDVAYAVSLFWPAPELLRSPTAVFLSSIAPLWAFGLLWLIVALVCFASAFMTNDRLGFGAAALVKALWAALMVWAAFAGVPRAYVSAAIWLVYCGVVVVISTWAERDGR